MHGIARVLQNYNWNNFQAKNCPNWLLFPHFGKSQVYVVIKKFFTNYNAKTLKTTKALHVFSIRLPGSLISTEFIFETRYVFCPRFFVPHVDLRKEDERGSKIWLPISFHFHFATVVIRFYLVHCFRKSSITFQMLLHLRFEFWF